MGEFAGGFSQGFGQQFQAQQDRAFQGEALKLASQRFKLEEKERGMQMKLLLRKLERDPIKFLQELGLVQPTPTGDLPQAPLSTTGPAPGAGMGGLELGGVDVTEEGDIRAQFRRPERERPIAVSPGAALVDPTTGQPIFTAPERPERPVAVGAGGALVDPRTGKQIFQSPDRPVTVAPGGTLVNPRTGQQIFQGAPAPQGPGATIVALAKSLREQGALQNDIEEAEFIQQFTGRPDLLQLILGGLDVAPSPQPGAAEQKLGGIAGTVRQRLRERGNGQEQPGPQPAPTAQRTEQAPVARPPNITPPPNFDFPAEITDTAQMVRHLRVRFGLSEQEAVDYVKRNRKRLGF